MVSFYLVAGNCLWSCVGDVPLM